MHFVWFLLLFVVSAGWGCDTWSGGVAEPGQEVIHRVHQDRWERDANSRGKTLSSTFLVVCYLFTTDLQVFQPITEYKAIIITIIYCPMTTHYKTCQSIFHTLLSPYKYHLHSGTSTFVSASTRNFSVYFPSSALTRYGLLFYLATKFTTKYLYYHVTPRTFV